MEQIDKIVDFEKYCATCEYKNLNEIKDPCNECLDCPVNEHTIRPIKYKKIEKESNNRIQKIKVQQSMVYTQPRMKISKDNNKTAIIDSNNIINKIKKMQSKREMK